MEGDGSRLIRQSERSFDAVGGMFPLLPIQRFRVTIPYIDVEEWSFASCAFGHDVNAPKCVQDVWKGEAAELPQLGVFAILSGDQITGEHGSVAVRGALGDHG
jgi:hypothetical protein